MTCTSRMWAIPTSRKISTLRQIPLNPTWLLSFFYLSNEGVSIIENVAHLGLPIPEKLKAVLEQLHDRAENEKEDE